MSNYTKISFNANKGAALLLQAFKHGVTSNMQNNSVLSNIYFVTFKKSNYTLENSLQAYSYTVSH